jgi:hypothetical protein
MESSTSSPSRLETKARRPTPTREERSFMVPQ